MGLTRFTKVDRRDLEDSEKQWVAQNYVFFKVLPLWWVGAAARLARMNPEMAAKVVQRVVLSLLDNKTIEFVDEVSQLLGDEWENMLMQMPRSQAEFMARAIKDHIADALSTLPRLVENNDASQIHFYFANVSGMRREIFPGLMQTYQRWQESRNPSTLASITQRSQDHWLRLARQMLEVFSGRGTGDLHGLERLVKQHYLQEPA